MYRIRFLKDTAYVVTITTIDEDGDLQVDNVERKASQGRLVQAEDAQALGDICVVNWKDNELSELPADDVEVHNWEPDSFTRSGGCCNGR